MEKRIFCFVLLSILASSPAWAKAANLYDFVSDKYVVNVEVAQFSVPEESKEIGGAELTDIFKEALRNRRSVKFNIAESPEDADLIIRGRVKNFVYSEDDPIDILIPIGLVVDLVTVQSYARLEFYVEVHDPGKGELLWKKNLKATLTKSDMSYEESIGLIMERAAKVFIRKCFGRPKK